MDVCIFDRFKGCNHAYCYSCPVFIKLSKECEEKKIMPENEKRKVKAVKKYRLTDKAREMLQKLDPMFIFKSFTEEYIEEVCKEYKKNYDKWANCVKTRCVYHPKRTTQQTFDKRCKSCDSTSMYGPYASE